jgi:hypothetical protein
MESEELRLLRENNAMLRYICQQLGGTESTAKEFLINLTANLISENITRR